MVITSFNSYYYFLHFLSPFIKKFFQEPQFYLFLHFWLHWIFAAAFRLSLVAATKGYSSHAVASLVAEHELWSAQASVVAAPRL